MFSKEIEAFQIIIKKFKNNHLSALPGVGPGVRFSLGGQSLFAAVDLRLGIGDGFLAFYPQPNASHEWDDHEEAVCAQSQLVLRRCVFLGARQLVHGEPLDGLDFAASRGHESSVTRHSWNDVQPAQLVIKSVLQVLLLVHIRTDIETSLFKHL